MAVSSVSSSSVAVAQAATVQVRQQTTRVEKSEGNDGDKDDHASSSQAVKSTTNSSGETLGTIISTKA